MDTQKFAFLQASSDESLLILESANLLMDIKNILASIVAHSSMIAVNLEQLNSIPSKLEINNSVLSISGLVESYTLISEQRKLLMKRLNYIKSLKITHCAA